MQIRSGYRREARGEGVAVVPGHTQLDTKPWFTVGCSRIYRIVEAGTWWILLHPPADQGSSSGCWSGQPC